MNPTVLPEACYLRLALLYPETLDTHPADVSLWESPRHVRALDTLKRLHAAGRGDYHELDKVMGVKYCSSLPEVSEFVGGPESLLAQIEDRAARRKLKAVVQNLYAIAEDPTQTTRDKVAQAVSELLALPGEEGIVKSWQEVLGVGFDRVELAHHTGGKFGIDTGWPKMDEVMGGWEGGKLYLIAGRPGAGKTAFGLQTIIAAAKAGVGVYVNSQEMGDVQVALRLLSQEGRISTETMRTGRLSDGDYARLAGAAGRLAALPGWWDTRAGISAETLRASVLKTHVRNKVGLVLVDYVQMMRGHGKTENKVYELESTAYTLKNLAKEINAPILALCQLNRESESPEARGKGPRKPPSISNLRGSGGLEQAADMVIILWQPDEQGKPREVEVRIAKNRDGRTGKFSAEFRKEYTLFEDLERV